MEQFSNNEIEKEERIQNAISCLKFGTIVEKPLFDKFKTLSEEKGGFLNNENRLEIYKKLFPVKFSGDCYLKIKLKEDFTFKEDYGNYVKEFEIIQKKYAGGCNFLTTHPSYL